MTADGRGGGVVARYARSGAIAGAISALAFSGVHHLFISDIWFSAIPMAVAGALCGACVGWTYALLVERRSWPSWLAYNVVYVVLFVLLGAASVAVFDPVTTVAAVIAANAPPGELFARAMPLTVAFVFVAAAAVLVLFGRRWRHYGPLLVTCAVLTGSLGLNVSAIGLVDIPRGSLHLVAELLGLIGVLNAVFVTVFGVIEHRSLRGPALSGS